MKTPSSGFTLTEILIATAITSILIVFLSQIFIGQTRQNSKQLENRAFILLSSLIQGVINNEDTCRYTFSDLSSPASPGPAAIIFANSPPVSPASPIIPAINLIKRVSPASGTAPAVMSRNPLITLNQMYNGKLWIQDIRFTGIPGSDPNVIYPAPPGMSTTCNNLNSATPTKLLACKTFIANVRLTAYAGLPNKSIPAELDLAHGQRKLVQNFPLGITVTSLDNKIVNCGTHSPPGISPRICYQLGKKFFDPTMAFPQPTCF